MCRWCFVWSVCVRAEDYIYIYMGGGGTNIVFHQGTRAYASRSQRAPAQMYDKIAFAA